MIAHGLGRLRLRFVDPAIGIELDVEHIRRSPIEEQPGCREIARAQAIVGTGLADLPIVSVLMLGSEANANRIAYGAADIAVDANLVEAAIGEIGPHFQIGGRLGRDEVDRATGRILAEQRALRSLEYFHPFDVHRCRSGHDQKWQRHLID